MHKFKYAIIALILIVSCYSLPCVAQTPAASPKKTVSKTVEIQQPEGISVKTTVNKNTTIIKPVPEPELGPLPKVEKIILTIMSYIVYFSQVLATFVITVGMIKALWTFIRDAILGRESFKAIRESRIELGHSFSLGLGFLIGASILKTAAAPNWDDIGKLSVIIAIRTILNFFLSREINLYRANEESLNRDNGLLTEKEKGKTGNGES